MRVIARELHNRRHHVRVWASRIDSQPLTRLNTTLGAQRFTPFWADGVEVRPIPMGVGSFAAASPMALMTVPGIRRFGYGALRKVTAPGYVNTVANALDDDMGPQDIIHCWGGEHVNWAAGRTAEKRGLPFVVTPFAHPGHWGDDPMNADFYARAAAVCALLPSEARVYESLGVDPAKIRVVGVPVTPLPPGGPDVRARHGIGDAPLVLFLGVKEPYKGYRTLLEASIAIFGDLPDARIAFVGPRTSSSEADFAGIDDDRIIEIGQVPDDEVAAWQRAATVLCLPSTSEIMPVSILETWAQGVPVVAARWWCAHDLIEHERDGLIVDPDAGQIARALLSVLKDREAAKKMGEAGRTKVRANFTPEAVAARHEDVYTEARA